MSTKSNIESLANELFYEIFDYLSTKDILYSFKNLNRRFSELIQQHHFQVDWTHLRKEQFENIDKIIALNQISTLKISHKWTVTLLNRIDFSPMKRLRSLILSNLTFNELRRTFESSSFSSLLKNLEVLKIQSAFIGGLDKERLIILKKIFSEMPNLRICQIPSIDVNDFDDLKPEINIERLSIDYCTIHGLDRLLQHVKWVRSLNVKLFTDLQNSTRLEQRNRSNVRCRSIRSLTISSVNNLQLSVLDELFRNSCPQVEHLRIFLRTNVISQSTRDFLDEQRWETFLRSFVSLTDFRCAFEFPVDHHQDVYQYANAFNNNQFFRQRNWTFSSEIFTFCFNTILRLHTNPYPRQRLDTIPMEIDIDRRTIYSGVRDLHLLIDALADVGQSLLSENIYENVVSLTLIANKKFSESSLFLYLMSVLKLDKILNLAIQCDEYSTEFLNKLIVHCGSLRHLSVSSYQSWTKLFHLSTVINRSLIRSVVVHELLTNFSDHRRIQELFEHLKVISIGVRTATDCYRLLTLLFNGHQTIGIRRLQSLTIKCDFDQPDVIAHWLRENISKKFTYKCTRSSLVMWF